MDRYKEFIDIILEEKTVERKKIREKLGVKDSNLNTYLTNAWEQGYDIEVEGPRHKRLYVYKGKLPKKQYISVDELIEKFKGKEIHKNILVDVAINDTKWQTKTIKAIIQQVSKAGVKVVGI